MSEFLPWIVLALVGVAFLWSRSGSKANGEAARRLVEAGASLVDVRTTGEFAAGHLAGAVNIPVDQIARRAGELDRERPVVVYCRSGARSAAAASTLRKLGFREVQDLGAMSNG